jgi:hypothetical protein
VRRRLAFWGVATCVVALVACGTSARAGDDDDNQSIEGKVINGVLGGIGIRTGPPIDYRERSPLVVPPRLELPKPEDSAAIEKSNPAWPVDADVRRRRQIETRAASKYSTPEEELQASGRPIARGELEAPGRAAASSSTASGNSTGALDESGRPIRDPGGKSIFDLGGVFGFGRGKEETATFTNEPTRETLIDPPPGYRTPSPNEPYGITAKRNESRPARLEDHGTDLR